MSKQHQITIRIGAAHYDVTISKPNGKVLRWDLAWLARKENRAERSKFHSRFMADYRRRNPMKTTGRQIAA